MRGHRIADRYPRVQFKVRVDTATVGGCPLFVIGGSTIDNIPLVPLYTVIHDHVRKNKCHNGAPY